MPINPGNPAASMRSNIPPVGPNPTASAPNMGLSGAGMGQHSNANPNILPGHGNPVPVQPNPNPTAPLAANPGQGSNANNLSQPMLWKGRICIVGGERLSGITRYARVYFIRFSRCFVSASFSSIVISSVTVVRILTFLCRQHYVSGFPSLITVQPFRHKSPPHELFRWLMQNKPEGVFTVKALGPEHWPPGTQNVCGRIA